jgi:hypothetical protein
MAEAKTCDLEHARPVRAVVKLELKSTRAGRPGHPMIRVIAICPAHVRQLRDLGLEVVHV